MEIILNNQISIFEYIFYTYLTPKQCIKFYSCNNILYNIYLTNNKFNSNYFTPKDDKHLREIVCDWLIFRKETILKCGHISFWNTINITNMSGLFGSLEYDGISNLDISSNFNDNISDWNTSNVINMEFMFYNAKKFNQPVNDWNTSNVINMEYMFCNAKQFNQPVNDWDTSNVNNMKGMFCNTKNFNQPVNDWNTSNVKNMIDMFNGAIKFNQPLNN